MHNLTDLDDQPLTTLTPRERILATASDLFYRFSIHTVGVDRIIGESGVAKMTFYKHFPSKARLIADYLRHKTVVWLHMLETATDRADLSPIERVRAIFDALDSSFQKLPFHGCPFVKGMAEFGAEADSPEVKATIAAYFESLHQLVADLIRPMDLDDEEQAVSQILALIQGSIVMAQATPNAINATACREAAAALLAAASASASAR